MSDAKSTLEGKKKWVKMTFENSQNQPSTAEAKLQDFVNTYNQNKSALDAVYAADTERYIEDLRKELKLLTINHEYGYKVNSWRSILRRVENFTEDTRYNNAAIEFARVQGEIEAAISQSELLAGCKDLKTLADEWNSKIKSTLSKKVADFELRMEWENESNALSTWVRAMNRDIEGLESKDYSPLNRVDQLQKTAEKTQKALDKFDRKKWAGFEPAQKLFKELEDLIAKSYVLMDQADNVTKEKQNAKDAKEDKELDDKIDTSPKDVAAALHAGKCSYSVTKDQFKRQYYFTCHTCGSGYGLCISCKRNGCHASDHNLTLTNGDFYCDCGHSGKCKSMNATSAASAGAQVFKCKKGHTLEKMAVRDCRCDECSSSASSSWNCSSCDYDMCFKCAEKQKPAATTPQTSGHAAAPNPAPAAVSSASHEKWIPGTTDKPAGTFDISSRQLKSDLRSTLDNWNRWAKDFNDGWREYIKYEQGLKESSKDQYEWYKMQVDHSLKKAADATDSYRNLQDQIAAEAPGGRSHQAVKHVEDEIKKNIALVRDARDEVDEYFDARRFTYQVEVHVQNARLAVKEGINSRDDDSSRIYINGYSGQEYTFGHYALRNCDVMRVALAELVKARAVLDSSPRGKGHPLAAEVVQLEKEAKEHQEQICVKWCTKSAKDGFLDKAKVYRDSLEEVFGSIPALKQLDQVIKDANDVKAKKEAEEEEQSRIEGEKQTKAREAEAARMAAAWKTPYTGGKIYCDKEVWTYDAKGVASNGDHTFEWDGTYLSGSMWGDGTWTEHSVYWRYSNRDIYSFAFDGKSFKPNNNEPVSFKWDGTVLMPNENDWKGRMVRFDGKVPVPVLVAVAMRPWGQRRIAECTGSYLCKSGLFNEGVQAKICDKCSSNSRTKCAICKDYLPFPRNPALMCKYCANRSGCVKCGGSSAYNAAFTCDTCKFAFSTQCVRTTQYN